MPRAKNNQGPGRSDTIEVLYAVMGSTAKDGEGIIATITPEGFKPLMCSSRSGLERLKFSAQVVANEGRKTLQIVRFERGRTVAEIVPERPDCTVR